jgi:hypothetical protein
VSPALLSGSTSVTEEPGRGRAADSPGIPSRIFGKAEMSGGRGVTRWRGLWAREPQRLNVTIRGAVGSFEPGGVMDDFTDDGEYESSFDDLAARLDKLSARADGLSASIARSAVSSGYCVGAAHATVLSWDAIGWAAIHGFLSWIYVIYYAVVRRAGLPFRLLQSFNNQSLWKGKLPTFGKPQRTRKRTGDRSVIDDVCRKTHHK